MARKASKVLIADERPDVIEAMKSLFPKAAVMTVPTSREAVELAAREEFDLVITEFAVPSVSGVESLVESRPSEAQATREKALILKEMRKMIQEIEEAARSKEAACEQILVQSQTRQEKILESLNEHVRQIDTERVELRGEVQRLHVDLEVALERNGELERTLAQVREETNRTLQEFQQKMTSLQEGRDRAAVEAQEARREKGEVEAELARTKEQMIQSAEALRKELLDTHARLKEAEREKSGLREELERARTEFSSVTDELSLSMATLTEDLNAAGAEAERLKQEKTRMESAISSLQQEAVVAKDLKVRVKSLADELKAAVGLAETALADKAKAEEKLLKLQENWEKYVAGR